jgi:hypothetical protein
LLALGSVWFAYDGYLNADPSMAEHLAFNRYGVRVLAYLTGLACAESLGDRFGARAARCTGAGVHALAAGWLAVDGWMAPDAVIAAAAAVARVGAVAMALAAVWLAVCSLPSFGSKRASAWGLSFVALGSAAALADMARTRADSALLAAGLAAVLLVAGIRLAWTGWRAASSSPAQAEVSAGG